MKMKSLLFFMVLSGALSFYSAGCGKDERAEKQAAQKKPSPSETAKIPETQKEEPESGPAKVAYHYDPSGKTDPFRPLIVEEAKSVGKGLAKKVGSIPPLERYDLDQLRLVGIITKVKPPRALIEDVTGDGYIVTPGMRLGRNEGVIITIDESEIIVEEKQLDMFGKLVTGKRVLKLYQPEELEEK